MSNISESKVSEIVKALSGLEDDLDSLNSKLADMKKTLNIRAQNEIDNLMKKTREMATKEAEIIISEAKEKAQTESAKIIQDGESKLQEVQAQIDASFDDAVKHVVSTVLKV
jgi:V/A-type H+-transporting ATPase subunit G/H